MIECHSDVAFYMPSLAFGETIDRVRYLEGLSNRATNYREICRRRGIYLFLDPAFINERLLKPASEKVMPASL